MVGTRTNKLLAWIGVGGNWGRKNQSLKKFICKEKITPFFLYKECISTLFQNLKSLSEGDTI